MEFVSSLFEVSTGNSDCPVKERRLKGETENGGEILTNWQDSRKKQKAESMLLLPHHSK